MVIFLHGPDSFRIYERLHVLRQGFQDKYDTTGYNIQSFSGSTISVEDIRSSLLSSGLFSQKRFVVIHDVLAMAEPTQNILIETIGKIDADAIIVCTAEEIPKNASDLSRLLLTGDRAEEYSKLSESQLRSWIQQRVVAAPAKISPEALLYLIQGIGNDLWTLHNCINQLMAYTKNIDITAVKIFVKSPLDDNIFHFTDALSEQNTKQALTVLHDQLALGVNVFYLLTMIARQVRILIEVKETGGKGLSLHPYVVKKVQVHAQRFGLEALQTMHHKLTDIDYQLKSSTADPQLLLDRFVIEVTQSA